MCATRPPGTGKLFAGLAPDVPQMNNDGRQDEGAGTREWRPPRLLPGMVDSRGAGTGWFGLLRRLLHLNGPLPLGELFA